MYIHCALHSIPVMYFYSTYTRGGYSWVLGPGVPSHIPGVGTLSPRIRGTHQHTYTPWLNYVCTLRPRIRDICTTLLSKVGTLSPWIRSTHTYTRWILPVVGWEVPTSTHILLSQLRWYSRSRITQTYWVRWVLSILRSGVPTHILGVRTLSLRIRSTRTYT